MLSRKEKNLVKVAATAATSQRPLRNVRKKTIKRRIRRTSLPDSFAVDYARTLSNPFEYGPLKLGFNTMVPTVLAAGYARSTLTVNADGSFGLLASPMAGNMFSTCNAGAAVATWVDGACQNYAALQGQLDTARVVSFGIRCFCLFPETSASGVLFAGQLVGDSLTDYKLAINTLSALPSATLGLGTKGALAVGLPVDLGATEFFQTTLNGSVSAVNDWSTPFICGRGFPAGTIVWFEVVLNLEGLPLNSLSTIGIDESDSPARKFSNFESFYHSARTLFKSPVIMDAAEGIMNFISPSLGAVTRSIRNSLGSLHDGARQALVAGSGVQAQQRQASSVMSEMEQNYHIPSAASSPRRFRRQL